MAFWIPLIAYLALATLPVFLLPRRLGVWYGLGFAALSVAVIVALNAWAMSDACRSEACMGVPIFSMFLVPGLLLNLVAGLRRMFRQRYGSGDETE